MWTGTITPDGLFPLVPLVVFFPIIGLLINSIFGRRMSEKVVGLVASSATAMAFVVSVLLAIALVGKPAGMTVPFAEWIHIAELKLDWSFRVDTLSVTMMLVVSGVGTLIHIYSIGYMHEDVRLNGDPGRFSRFFVFMNLFIAAMMLLVSSANYMMLFVGWEGVGLCSYLLIGFWYDKGKDGIGNAIAAKKAFVTNRIGDLGFLMATFLIFWNFRAVDFETISQRAIQVADINSNVVLAITLFMLLAVAGKSAQLPLYVWLPDAMAGPTPVSALIHAATMVTAGVYLVARSAPIFTLAPQAQTIVAAVGGLTALFAATIALAQFDIKKVLAYSTISQLGFMVAAVGMGAFVAGMFHLVTHAFFKALLFLSAGSVIQGVEHGLHHAENDPKLKKALKLEHPFETSSSKTPGGVKTTHFDPQDMRNMGGLKNRMKITFWVYVIGALALAGIVPFAGFWSKDEILAEASHLQPAIYWMLTITAFFTAFYMGRQVFLVFFGKARTTPAAHARENPPVMTVPLIILAVLSVLGGMMNLPGLHTFTGWLENTLGQATHLAEMEIGSLFTINAASLTTMEAVEQNKEAISSTFTIGGMNLLVALISTVLAVGAIIAAYAVYRRRYEELQTLPVARKPDDPMRAYLGPIFTWMENKWYVDELYKAALLNPYIAFSRFLANVVDWQIWHDWFHDKVIANGFKACTRLLAVRIDLGGIDAIANGIAALTQWLAESLRGIQNGLVRSYAFSIFVGVVVILGYLILR